MKLIDALKRRTFMAQLRPHFPIGKWYAALRIDAHEARHEWIEAEFVLENASNEAIIMDRQWFGFSCDEMDLLAWKNELLARFVNDFSMMSEFEYEQGYDLTYSKLRRGIFTVVYLSDLKDGKATIWSYDGNHSIGKGLIESVLAYELKRWGFESLNDVMRDELIKRNMLK